MVQCDSLPYGELGVSGIDDCSLDIFIPFTVHLGWLRRGHLTRSLLLKFSILPGPSNANVTWSVVDWGG